MGVIDILATVFINTFGITQPTEKTRRAAAWFILGLLALALLVVVLAGIAVYRVLHH